MREAKIGTIILLLFSTFILSAQCIEGNCKTGLGVKLIGKGISYKGEFAQGKFHGKGEITKRSATIYKGEFRKGKRHGQGLFVDKAGTMFVGNFVAGKLEGRGSITYKDGRIYQGEVRKGIPHGSGHCSFDDGSTYQGEWKSGFRSGQGTQTTTEGAAICGLWGGDQLLSENKKQLEAITEVVKDKDCTSVFCHQEQGVFKYGDGSLYIGAFTNGSPGASGRCEYINGDLYEGGWDQHAPHGEGTMHFANGQTITAIWNHGSIEERIYKEESLSEYKIKPAAQSPLSLGKSEIYAVVVGVAAYPHLSSLKYTDDDAYKLYAHLKSPEGGALPDDHVQVLIDESATKTNIAKTMQTMFQKADANDVIMLYLAGHGLKGSYVPYDFDGANNLIEYDKLLEIFESSAAKSKICITDACHSGSLVASRSGYSAGLEQFYEQIQSSSSGVALMSSSSIEEVSLEYSGLRQGIFSHFLIRGLKGEANVNNDNMVSIDELYKYIYKEVGAYTNYAQTPHIGGDYDDSMPVSWVYEN